MSTSSTPTENHRSDDTPRNWNLCDATGRDRSNQRRIQLWSLLWMITWLGVNAAASFDYLSTGLPTILATLVTVPLGIAVIFAHIRYLRETDELRRKIELDALALSYGVGVVGTMTWFLVQRAGYVSEMDLLGIAMLMMLTYSLASFVGRRRYA